MWALIVLVPRVVPGLKAAAWARFYPPLCQEATIPGWGRVDTLAWPTSRARKEPLGPHYLKLVLVVLRAGAVLVLVPSAHKHRVHTLTDSTLIYFSFSEVLVTELVCGYG